LDFHYILNDLSFQTTHKVLELGLFPIWTRLGFLL
uniref:DUF4205 domain-containing protein n=1 Tax=Haemonchus placei TaxID=6290 RepID=A0A0N4X781_HAEPC